MKKEQLKIVLNDTIALLNGKEEILRQQNLKIVKLSDKITDLKEAAEFWEYMRDKESKKLVAVLDVLDWFSYHNKNLTKEQCNKINELHDLICEPKKRG